MTFQHSGTQFIDHMVTTQQNEYIASRYEGHARWLVELNDGTLCYQDDGRPDIPEKSGWIRLHEYCLSTGKYIIGMYIQFRRETIALPANKDGYYFYNSALSWLNDNRTFYSYVVGYLENGKIYTKKYKIPELIVEDEDVREVREDDLGLILRKDNV